MEQKIELSTAQPSLLILTDDCILDVLEFLHVEDCNNLAHCCSHLRYIANHIFKKYSKFEINSSMVEKGDEYVDRMLTHIGQHVSSLRVDCCFNRVNLSKIINDWPNIERLRIDNYYNKSQKFEEVASFYCFDNIKMFTADNCQLGGQKSCLNNFHQLKCLNVLQRSDLDFRIVLENNPDIESFMRCVQYGDKFDFELLENIPKVERLCLSIQQIDNLSNLNSLLKLNQLTKLRLKCNNININHLLRELARKGTMEELVLERCKGSNSCLQLDLFEILKLFDKLILLVIEVTETTYLTSIVWPVNLKYLLLRNFKLADNDLMQTIKQLKNLESLDLAQCSTKSVMDISFSMNRINTIFNDVTELAQQIFNVISQNDKKQRLTVILPHVFGLKKDRFKKYLYESQWLRLLHSFDDDNPLGIYIRFPGYHDS